MDAGSLRCSSKCQPADVARAVLSPQFFLTLVLRYRTMYDTELLYDWIILLPTQIGGWDWKTSYYPLKKNIDSHVILWCLRLSSSGCGRKWNEHWRGMMASRFVVASAPLVKDTSFAPQKKWYIIRILETWNKESIFDKYSMTLLLLFNDTMSLENILWY